MFPAGDVPPAAVPALGPIVFTLTFAGVPKTVDLSDLPCPRLVRPLAAALASIGGDTGTVRTWAPDVQQMVRYVREFVEHAARSVDADAAGVGLADVTADLVDGFEAALAARYGPGARPVGLFMATVVRLLRLADQAEPGVITAATQARLGYATSTPPRRRSPLDAYPLPVFEAIKQAAFADVAAIRDRVAAGRALAATGSDPGQAGWSDRRNVLWHIAANGPLAAAQQLQDRRHVVRCAPGGIEGFNTQVFLGPPDMVPFLVALICVTGLEPECAKGLKAGCLSSPARGFVTLAYDKKRAHVGTRKTMRVRDGGANSAGTLLRTAIRLTDAARELAGGDALWVAAREDGRLHALFEGDYEMTARIRTWAARHHLHELTDYGGGPVRLNLRRLRKSCKSRMYLQSGGILDDFATGHSKQVAAARYGDIGAHRELHDDAVEAGLSQALAVALPPPVVATLSGEPLAPPGNVNRQLTLTPVQAHAATSADTDVFLCSCTDFHDSPFARTPGSPCPVAVWGCLECPNAVFTQRHLPSLVSFADWLEDQREALSGPQWQVRHGLAHERITCGIFPAFTSAQLAEANARAGRSDPLTDLPLRLLDQLT
jgi:hypothetical protein